MSLQLLGYYAHPSDVTIPDRLAAAVSDRYRIERALGAGGMATVYLAQDRKHDRKVAVKVLCSGNSNHR